MSHHVEVFGVSVCEDTSDMASVCEDMSGMSSVCEDMSGLASVCEDMSDMALVCEDTSDMLSVCEDTSDMASVLSPCISFLFLSPCTALSAVPQMCHSGSVLGFCLKVTRQVEENLIIWLNSRTFAVGVLFTYLIDIQHVFSIYVYV
jgi:hypothetical protein